MLSKSVSTIRNRIYSMLPLSWRLDWLPLSWQHSWVRPLAVVSAMTFLYVWRWRHKWRRPAALQGRVVIVTGASSGLGQALAHQLFAAGCRLILMSRDTEQLRRVRDEVMLSQRPERVYPPVVVGLDLTDSAAAAAAARRAVAVYGHVDVLINNAGISYRGEALSTSAEVDFRLMQVNFLGHVVVSRTVLQSMVERRSGHVVSVSSIQGRIGIPYRSAYAASKHALQAWCDCVRAEVAQYNVHLTVVSPSYIATNLSSNAVRADGGQYGRVDATTASGLPASEAAGRVVAALVARRSETLMSPLKDRLAVLLRALAPDLFFYLMKLRANSGTGKPV